MATATPATDDVASDTRRPTLELEPALDPCYAVLASTPGGEGHDATNP